MQEKTLHDVRFILDALKKHYGFRTYGDLEKFLGVKEGLLSVWKSRNSIADEEPFLTKCNGLSYVWFKTGEGPMFIKDTETYRAQVKEGLTPYRPEGAFEIPVTVSKIPILSWAQAGADGFFLDSHVVGGGFGEIIRPYDVNDPSAYALIIKGDSMAPKYEAGDIVVVSPAAGVQTGDYAVVKLVDGQVMAKRVKAKNSVYILESVNPDHESIECPKENIVFMHRIVWVKQRG